MVIGGPDYFVTSPARQIATRAALNDAPAMLDSHTGKSELNGSEIRVVRTQVARAAEYRMITARGF
jgi:hypothetical protein